MRKSVTYMFVLVLVIGSSLTAGADWFWCIDEDEVHAAVHPETGDITLTHDKALYNCCPLPPVFDVTLDGDTLTIWEDVSLSEEICLCLCCYSLQVTVTDVPPGQYTVVYGWLDEETGTPAEQVLNVTVPEIITGQEPAIALGSTSPCLDSSSVPDDEEQAVTWGTIKGMYR